MSNSILVSNEVWVGGQNIGCIKLSTAVLDYIHKEPDLTIILVKGSSEIFTIDNPCKYDLHSSAIDLLLSRVRDTEGFDPFLMTTVYVYIN